MVKGLQVDYLGGSRSQDNSLSHSGESEMYRNLRMNVAGVMRVSN